MQEKPNQYKIACAVLAFPGVGLRDVWLISLLFWH